MVGYHRYMSEPNNRPHRKPVASIVVIVVITAITLLTGSAYFLLHPLAGLVVVLIAVGLIIWILRAGSEGPSTGERAPTEHV